MKTKLLSEDPHLSISGIEADFRASKEAQQFEEDDLRHLTVAFEHGQWWVIVNVTGDSFSVVDVERNGKLEIGFEQV